MLYSGSLSVFQKGEGRMKPYYIMTGHGNDAVVPDESDLSQHSKGKISWEGFRVSYLAKLMRPEAEGWMKHVALEATSQDVALISTEKSKKECYRILLAETMMNMFSGQSNLRYVGELSESGSHC